MAGGGYGKGAGIRLQDRIRTHDENGDLNRPAAGDLPAKGPRHCWVLDPLGQTAKRAGLLLEWRRTSRASWEGLVVYEARDNGRRVTVQEWVPSHLLDPAG